MLKVNSFKDFFRETFSDIFETYPDQIKVIGKKMYFNTGKGKVLSVEFTGPNQLALVNITLTAATRYGVIDLTEIPLSRVFYKDKKDNEEKSVLVKQLNSDGAKTVEWKVDLEDEDRMVLNELISDYIEIFLDI